jgi:hypothetical protein
MTAHEMALLATNKAIGKRGAQNYHAWNRRYDIEFDRVAALDPPPQREEKG